MPGGFTVARPHGEAEWAGEGRTVVRDCLQCCHCQHTFFVTPGSGKRRGYCMQCGQVTCGAKKCGPCIHWRKKFELIDAGKADKSIFYAPDIASLPTSASVPALPKSILLGRG